MILATLILLADGDPPAPGRPPGWDMIPLLILPFLLMLWLMRSQRRKERELLAMTTNLAKGDEVLTVAGIYGTVISVHETKDEVVVKVDDGTRMRMTKASITRNMTKEEAAKAAQNAPKG